MPDYIQVIMDQLDEQKTVDVLSFIRDIQFNVPYAGIINIALPLSEGDMIVLLEYVGIEIEDENCFIKEFPGSKIKLRNLSQYARRSGKLPSHKYLTGEDAIAA